VIDAPTFGLAPDACGGGVSLDFLSMWTAPEFVSCCRLRSASLGAAISAGGASVSAMPGCAGVEAFGIPPFAVMGDGDTPDMATVAGCPDPTFVAGVTVDASTVPTSDPRSES
jgi:hypothetical protein